ncbi:alkaline phosphatase family protein [Sphingomonas astaxanthinifaciens]|uniref:Alkaline phosphatase n=1 Tax=Sphingomonas astaxanthinifaciens DSM 22298 TaxID=1123267 RepID=A0ABQ5Z2A7_9SPHN|nr:alkaline phosphatase family protein [Sphingomonas astaxanthinifaciens]GLR46904.1 alkaline phosphatase [Sphingomonas astaxanthinifaciens DSM 22298]
MRHLLLAAAALVATAAPAAAQGPAKPPKLIVAISLDQFSADLFDDYRPHFTGGLKRLAESGVTFSNGYQSHAATETCPGHSTLLTGRHPANTRIVANDWIDQSAARADKTVYCAEDERVPGSTSSAYTVSPWHLAVTTLGDRLKAASPRSRNVAVAGKDRAAIMMGGRAVDQRWYWDGKSWATDLAAAPVPQTVAAVRAATQRLIAAGDGPLDPPALCQARAKRYDLTPTLSVGDGRFPMAAGDSRAFRNSPRFDGMTLALAMGLVGEMGLGKGPATDILSVGLSGTDVVGHAFGRGGQEMCLQMLSLDRDLGGFLDRLDQTGIDYAVVLSADHGGLDLVERLRDQGNARAARLDPAFSVDAIGKQLAGRIGRSGSVLLGGSVGDVWIDRSLSPADRRKVEAGALAIARAHPQVEAVFTAAEIAATPLPSGDPSKWTIPQRLRASFDPARSGDILVVLKEFITPAAKPSAGYVAGHGTVWDYDRRVPILFVARGLKPASPGTATDTVDILPTVASWIGLQVPKDSVDGVCRSEAARCR